ncbi:MAG: HAMP domain-containing sensor histidine kinase [Pseudomonadota bacterium]
MSSATKPSLLRSSSVRLAVLLVLVIWGVSAGIIIAIVAASERALLAPLNDEVIGLTEFLTEQLRSDELDLFEWYGDDIDTMFVDTGDLDADSPTEFLTAYTERLLEQQDERGDPQRGTQERLWLLEASDTLGDVDRPLELYLGLMREETPDRWHDALSGRVLERADSWPDKWRWDRLDISARLELLLSALQGRTDDEDICLRRLPLDDDLDWRNTGLAAAEFEAVEITVSDVLEEDRRLCWTRTLSLGNGGALQIGRFADSTLVAVSTNRAYRTTGVVVGLLVAIVLGALLGQRIYARVRTINALTDQIRHGDLDHRLRLSGSGGDFDQLSANINAMLDKIVSLMSGVRQVSDNIAHDLRSPLTRLRNRIEHLQTIEQPTTDDIRPIAEQADEVLATFSSLLRIAQLEQGSQRQSFTTFDLGDVLREVVDLYEPVFSDAGIQLLLDLQRDRVVVSGDSHLWTQVFTNLLENSLRYASESTSVTVSLTATRHHAIAVVHDQGPGVPDHALPRLTERFFRGDKHRETGGTGLGLALVAAICRIHEGSVDFVNEGGLKVTLRLPRNTQATPAN